MKTEDGGGIKVVEGAEEGVCRHGDEVDRERMTKLVVKFSWCELTLEYQRQKMVGGFLFTPGVGWGYGGWGLVDEGWWMGGAWSCWWW